MRTLRYSLLLLLVAACTRSETASKAPAASPPPAATKAVEEAAKPTIEDTTFKLALVGEPAYKAGERAAVQLTLEARGGYHVNQEYPIRVEVKAPPGVTLEKASLERADAAQFGEQSARFELPFSGEAGTHELTASVDFAVCTAETCVPDQRTLALPLTIR